MTTDIELRKPEPEVVRPDAISFPGEPDVWHKLRWFWRPEHGWRARLGDEVYFHIKADTSGFQEAVRRAGEKMREAARFR